MLAHDLDIRRLPARPGALPAQPRRRTGAAGAAGAFPADPSCPKPRSHGDEGRDRRRGLAGPGRLGRQHFQPHPLGPSGGRRRRRAAGGDPHRSWPGVPLRRRSRPTLPPAHAASEGATTSPPDHPGGRPSIAVLPFQPLGMSPELAILGDAIPHEIIEALSRLRWLAVIARGSSFRFRQVAGRSGSGVDGADGALRPVRDHREPRPHHRGDARTDRHQLPRDHLGRPARRPRRRNRRPEGADRGALVSALETHIPFNEARLARLSDPDGARCLGQLSHRPWTSLPLHGGRHGACAGLFRTGGQRRIRISRVRMRDCPSPAFSTPSCA